MPKRKAINDDDESHGVPDSEDELLDSAIQEGDPEKFWEAKQREVITSVVDYNLGTLADLVRGRTIDLSPKYQRRHRWDAKRQSKLIESFLMNVPVPPVFLNEDEYGKYSVIDGKQRLQAISSFFSGRLTLTGLEVFSDINGKTFDDLPEGLKTVLRVRPTVRAVIVLRQSDTDVKFEVFKRLNTGGVKLNAQEIRNSTYPGPLNNLILKLSEADAFHALLGITSKNTDPMWREMRDAELVLRYFTFRETWETFTGGVMRQMDRYMANGSKLETAALQQLETEFLESIEKVRTVFGKVAFQRWQPEKAQWRKQVLASLYDSQMLSVRDFSLSELGEHAAAIRDASKRLFDNDEFRKSIDAATNTPKSLKHRIQATKTLVKDAIRGG